MYKLVALDMDGTLLNKNQKISDRVKKAIAEARAKGVKIILSSGRGFKGIEKYVKELHLDELVVSLNGAAVTDASGEKIVFDIHMEPDVSRRIIELQKEYDIFSVNFIGLKMYVEELNEKALYFSTFEGVEVIAVGNMLEFYNTQPISKMLMIEKHEKFTIFKERLLEELGQYINATFSLPDFLEAYNINVNKGLILHKVANYYGIKREEVIAIGDGENDIYMIEYAGLGVAMGNAMDSVKNAADIITKSNAEDGVAHVIERYILNV
ncbi:MAG: haloacid dehalogenase-like hydrolase [Clostridiales bacterium]|nr:haloacid dehalogenase-like hydrolase [Clostridiales bacterium]